ncbi:sialin-like [Littorina saxatilis]|uniref:sialin-like n=1 Tax=Littorina saxatilis TaxID=31220 RepID=UPI0038B58DEA
MMTNVSPEQGRKRAANNKHDGSSTTTFAFPAANIHSKSSNTTIIVAAPATTTFNTIANNSNDSRNDQVPTVDTRETTWQHVTSCRWVLAYMGSLMTLLVMLLRHCLSMAIVCISNLEYERVVKGENSSRSEVFPNETVRNGVSAVMNSSGSDVEMYSPNYIPEELQGVVLSSYYYGYITTPFIGGLLAERFGAKRVLTVAMTISAALTLVTPLAIRFNIYLTVVLRILLGLVSGVCIPSVTGMWAYWAPTEEKAKLLVVTFSGSSTGSIVANFVSGFLCGVPVDDGWPFIFYTYGGLALAWAIVWHFVAFDTPEQHPRIEPKERVLIRRRRPSDPSVKIVKKPPMKTVFTSPAFVSLLVTHMSYSWFLSTFATYLPIYLNDVLLFDPELNGVLSSLPFVMRVIFSVVFAVLSDRITTSGLLTVTRSRKLFQCIGLVVPGLLIVGVGFLNPDQQYLVVAMLIVNAAFQSACMSGFRINHLDIAPRFAGSLAGMTVTFATSAAIISPLVISPLVADKQQSSWRTAFIITAALSFVGAVLFAVFGSGEEQEWAKEQKPPSRMPSFGDVIEQHGVTSGEDEEYAGIEIEMKIPEGEGSFDIPEVEKSLDNGRLNFAFCEEEVATEATK